ncbi:hypothetical protein, partial [Cyanobacterium aponinum]|uniref:hypothetical protein n=1 Tax=Cyanobacterium aponinum TaxID=379064 RepID=UPI0019D47FEC
DCMVKFWNYPRSENIVDTIYNLCVFKIDFYENFSSKFSDMSEFQTKRHLLKDILYGVAIFFNGDCLDRNEKFLEIARYMDLAMGKILTESDFESLFEFKNKETLKKLRDIYSQN